MRGLLAFFKREIPLAARLTWEHKVLWVFAAASSLIFFIYQFITLDTEPSQATFFQVLVMCLVPCLMVIASFTLIPISLIALILGLYKGRSGEPFTFDSLFNEARGYLLKYWGLMLIFFVVLAVLAALALFVTLIGQMAGISLAIGPWLIIVLPLLILIYVWAMSLTQFSTLGIVLNNYSATDTIKRAWRLIWSQFKRVLIAGFVFLLISTPISYALQYGYDLAATPLLVPPGSTLNGILYLATVLAYVTGTSIIAVFISSLWLGLFLDLQPDLQTDRAELG